MSTELIQKFFRAIIIIGTILTIVAVIYFSFPYIYPILIAYILALLFQPMVLWFENRLKLPKIPAIIITVTVFLTICTGALFLAITELYQGTLFLADKIPSHYQQFVLYLENMFNTHILPMYEKVLSYIDSLDQGYQQTVKNYIATLSDLIASGGASFLQVAISNIPMFIAAIPSSITNIVFILIASCMISYEMDRIHSFFKSIFPTHIQSIQNKIASHFKHAVVGYFRAQLILVFTTACIILIGLLILKVEHALTIVLFAAIADIIPYVGTGIIFIPWIIFNFFSGNYALTIGLSILYGFVVILRQILEPKVLSSSIGIHPLIMLIGMFVGIKVLGFIGLFLSPILLVLIKGLMETGAFHLLFKYIKG
ncbi:sporulation integral membrane protein YtvI [Oceanobacillus sp. 1P07AA]|uniref:sporulation integral membrane protein YtvI n=1 Tax=Oceanobacillus sp. 1P07AA TaxID=3132293 RepID=UPI0039A4D0D4